MTLSADVRATFTADGAEAFTVDADLAVEPGETLVVLGPSGSGKTLLLETIAGFHSHAGRVSHDDRDLTDRPPERRDFAFVFQDYALFPHMTVAENVAYGTRYHDDVRDPAALLADLGVAHLAERYPPTLSGGEQQRVALARALAVRPAVMLLDEPLAALDVPTRRSLRDDLADVLTDVTSVYVTHNRTTARALADRIAVMRDGRIVQLGTPEDVFERPNSPMVARFTGANAVDLADAPSLAVGLDGSVAADGGDDSETSSDDAARFVAIRPEAIEVSDSDTDDGHLTLDATVERAVQEDASTRLTVSVDETTLDAFADDPPPVGTRVALTIPSERVHRCPASDQRR